MRYPLINIFLSCVDNDKLCYLHFNNAINHPECHVSCHFNAEL